MEKIIVKPRKAVDYADLSRVKFDIKNGESIKKVKLRKVNLEKLKSNPDIDL